MKTTTKKKMRLEFIGQARAYCGRHGRNLSALAEVLGVPASTVLGWEKTHAAFRQAVADGEREYLAAGRQDRDEMVRIARAKLMDRVVGLPQVEKRTVVDADGKETVTVTESCLAPDVGAIKEVLQKLDRATWGNKVQVESPGDVVVTIVRTESQDSQEKSG